MSKINQDSGKHQGNKKLEAIKDDLWGTILPTELLELILSNLTFVVDIINFHVICKTWRSITVSVSPPPPRQLNPTPLPCADSSFPLLFHMMDFQRKYRIFHPLYNYTWDFDFPPQVPARDGPKKLYFSKYGWLLMSRFFKPAMPFLFNPLTQETIKLPAIPEFPGYLLSMFFTCPPSQSDCLVVAIAGRRNSSIYVHKLGEADWKMHDLKSKMDHYFEPVCHPILYQGLCYCLGLDRNLVVFDIQDIEHTWIVHKVFNIPSPSEFPARLTALVEHDGQLLVVLIGVGRPYIFELDLKTKFWKLAKNLGKNSLFISKGASFSQRAIVSGTGNKIFYPLVLKNKTDSFRFYSLATTNGAKISKRLVAGSTVRVVSGTFAEFVGSLKKLNRKTGKATVGFTLFGKESLVELDAEDIVLETK
ncbi:hypothetical protein CCACVL1_00406 [Corchorus capsularis]|uniref:F-box domain-containing protein n=1 Tax=Corchorus capsularis TaxID=210143 RepID=A0A1R3KX00_COCAP|nr:hypothetical protein CCACVL1_00406 [Corchorus capsularis]